MSRIDLSVSYTSICLFLVPISFPLRIGRIPVLLVSVLSVLVFGLCVAFSVDMAMFSTLRFFQGFCLAAIRLSLYVLSKFLFLTFLPSYSMGYDLLQTPSHIAAGRALLKTCFPYCAYVLYCI